MEGVMIDKAAQDFVYDRISLMMQGDPDWAHITAIKSIRENRPHLIEECTHDDLAFWNEVADQKLVEFGNSIGTVDHRPTFIRLNPQDIEDGQHHGIFLCIAGPEIFVAEGIGYKNGEPTTCDDYRVWELDHMYRIEADVRF
jgi:hypothetical protein